MISSPTVENGNYPSPDRIEEMVGTYRRRVDMWPWLVQGLFAMVSLALFAWVLSDLRGWAALLAKVGFWLSIFVLVHLTFPALMVTFYIFLAFNLFLIWMVPYRMWRKRLIVVYLHEYKTIGRAHLFKGTDEHGQHIPSTPYAMWYAWRFLKFALGTWMARAFLLVIAAAVAAQLLTGLPLAPAGTALASVLLALRVKRRGVDLRRWPHVRPTAHELPMGDVFYLLGRAGTRFMWAVKYASSSQRWLDRRVHTRTLYLPPQARILVRVWSIEIHDAGGNLLEVPRTDDRSSAHQELTLGTLTYVGREVQPYRGLAMDSLSDGTRLVEHGVGADAQLAKDKTKGFIFPGPERAYQGLGLKRTADQPKDAKRPLAPKREK